MTKAKGAIYVNKNPTAISGRIEIWTLKGKKSYRIVGID